MCFSPQGDLVAGVAVSAIGVDACLHLRGRREFAAVAALPLLFGLHQIDESFVWWGLRGDVPHQLSSVAMWIYLIFALVVLPVLAPLLVLGIERTRRERRRIVPFVVLGAVVSAILLEAMLVGHPRASLGSYHIAYSIGLQHGIAVIGLYVVATCGPLLLSGSRSIMWFGVANLVAVVVLARLCADGFTSLWCLYAALVSAAIALHLRRTAARSSEPAMSTA
ncbi:MAG TPA: DUF6629 family protein [Acidimicrobiales bacterium]|nr:DUF6629 family protein [Acidimicrobiales bacterium]